MTRPPQRELFVSERPVRSMYEDDRVYARRRLMTVAVLALVLGGVVYAFVGSQPSGTESVPTIKAEGEYKEKPSDPGGIDIPHQDVRVYDQLETKKGLAPQVEHLLPPPEAPQHPAKEAPRTASETMQSPTSDSAALVAPAPTPAPVPTVSATSSAALPTSDAALSGEPVVKPITTTATSASVEPPSVPASAPASKGETLSIEQIIKSNGSSSAAPPSVEIPSSSASAPTSSVPASVSGTLVPPSAKTSGTSSKATIQLASMPNEAQARAIMDKLQQKYASQLGGAKLRLARVDLGARGIYYRVQSQNLPEAEALRVCSALKQLKAGCILVGK